MYYILLLFVIIIVIVMQSNNNNQRIVKKVQLNMKQQEIDFLLNSQAIKKIEQEYFPDDDSTMANNHFDFQQYMASLGTFTLPVQKKSHKIININKYCREDKQMSKTAIRARQSIQFRKRALERQHIQPQIKIMQDGLGSKRVKVQSQYYRTMRFNSKPYGQIPHNKSLSPRQTNRHKKSGPPYYPTIITLHKQTPKQQTPAKLDKKNPYTQLKSRLNHNKTSYKPSYKIQQKSKTIPIQSKKPQNIKNYNPTKDKDQYRHKDKMNNDSKGYRKYLIKDGYQDKYNIRHEQHNTNNKNKDNRDIRDNRDNSDSKDNRDNRDNKDNRDTSNEKIDRLYDNIWIKKEEQVTQHKDVNEMIRNKEKKQQSAIEWKQLGQEQIKAMQYQLDREREQAKRIFMQKQKQIQRREQFIKQSINIKNNVNNKNNNQKIIINPQTHQSKSSQKHKSTPKNKDSIMPHDKSKIYTKDIKPSCQQKVISKDKGQHRINSDKYNEPVEDWRKQLRKITGYNPSQSKYRDRDREQIRQSGFHRIYRQQAKSRAQGYKQEQEVLNKEKLLRIGKKQKWDSIDY